MIKRKNYKREAIILAGGLGTRLRSEVADVPKCMAPVNGRPFLDYVVNHAINQGVEHIVFCLGYMSSIIEAHIMKNYGFYVDISIVVEKEPLGTGGAIMLGSRSVVGKKFLVLNGDSLFALNYDFLYDKRLSNNQICIVGLKPMVHFDRYGSVTIDKNGYIAEFLEKKPTNVGFINGGIYLVNKDLLSSLDLPQKHSFEKEILEKYAGGRTIKGVISESYFIDIGIPSDYQKASNDLKDLPLIFQNNHA